MHNLKEIRNNIDLFRKKVSERNTKINLDNLVITTSDIDETAKIYNVNPFDL